MNADECVRRQKTWVLVLSWPLTDWHCLCHRTFLNQGSLCTEVNKVILTTLQCGCRKYHLIMQVHVLSNLLVPSTCKLQFSVFRWKGNRFMFHIQKLYLKYQNKEKQERVSAQGGKHRNWKRGAIRQGEEKQIPSILQFCFQMAMRFNVQKNKTKQKNYLTK